MNDTTNKSETTNVEVKDTEWGAIEAVLAITGFVMMLSGNPIGAVIVVGLLILR